MGTYSNLIPAAAYNGDSYTQGSPISWNNYEDSGDSFVIPYKVGKYNGDYYLAAFRFDLPKEVEIANVTITANADMATGTSAYLIGQLVNSPFWMDGQVSENKSAYVYDGVPSRTFYFSGLGFNKTNSFYVVFSLQESGPCVDTWRIRATVSYKDPAVTATAPSGSIFNEKQSFEYIWSVSNGTQSSAVVQESTDGSSWSNVGRVSGSTTSMSGTARRTISSGSQQFYWRVVVTFSDGTTVTSTSKSYSVLEPPPPPDDPPYFGSVTAEIIQPAGLPSVFANTYIAGISKCKITAYAYQGTNPIRSVTFRYPEYSGSVAMTQETGAKYVGTTSLALPQSTTFTVEVIDSTGLYADTTLSVTVQPYADPTIQINTLIRCDALGAETDLGEYYKVRVTVGYSSVDGKNSIQSIKAGVRDGTMHDIQNRVSFIPTTPELLDEDATYVIIISAKDLVGHTTTVQRSLSGKLRDVIFRRDVQHKTAHIGVGMSPAGSERATVQLPPDGTIIIGGQDLISWLQSKLGDFPGWNQS